MKCAAGVYAPLSQCPGMAPLRHCMRTHSMQMPKPPSECNMSFLLAHHACRMLFCPHAGIALKGVHHPPAQAWSSSRRAWTACSTRRAAAARSAATARPCLRAWCWTPRGTRASSWSTTRPSTRATRCSAMQRFLSKFRESGPASHSGPMQCHVREVFVGTQMDMYFTWHGCSC